MVPMTLPEVPTTPTAAAPKKKLRRPVLIAIIAGGLVLLLGLGAAAFALVNLVLGGGQSASASAVAFPKSTLYWAEFAIDPSMPQKVEAFRFVNEIDALKDAIEDSDLDVDLDDPDTYSDFKKSLWEFLVDGDNTGIDTDLDYDDDVLPWIGSRVSVGMLPSDDLDEPSLIVAIEARDTAAGVEAVEELVDDLDVDVDLEVDVRNGYVIVATEGVDIDDVYEDGTLDKSERFAEASKAAGEWGWASVYVDLGGLYSMINDTTSEQYSDVDYWIDEIENNYYGYVDDSAYEYYDDCSAFDAPENVGDEDYEDFECNEYYEYDGEYYEYYDDFARAWVEDNAERLAEEKVDEYADYADQQADLVKSLEGTTAFVVSRFADASFEVSGVVSGVKDLSMAPGSGDGESQLPASTVALLSVSGLGDMLDSALTDENLSLSSSNFGGYSPYGYTPEPVTRDDVVDWFDDELGIDFPDDLADLFGAKVQVVVDRDLDFDDVEDGGSIGDVAETGAAIVITTDDADATASAWEDLLENAEDNLDTALDIEVTQDGKRVILSGGDYLETVLDPDERLGDVDAFGRAVPQHETASSMLYIDVAGLVDLYGDLAGSGDYLDFLDGVQAFGFTTRPLSGDSYAFVLRVTTEAD